MNGVKKWLVAVAVVLGLSMPVSAQEGFSVRISSNILWRLFWLLDEEQEASEYHNDDSSSIWDELPWRLNGGVKYQFPLLGNLDMFASADVFYQSLRNTPVKSFEELEVDEVPPAAVNLPVLVGLNFTVLKLDEMSVWAEAGVGANFRRIPQYLVAATRTADVEVATSYHWGSTATWKAGVGVTFVDKFSLELSYSAFCCSEVKGGLFAKEGNVIGDWAHKLADGIVAGKRNHSMLFLCVGIHF